MDIFYSKFNCLAGTSYKEIKGQVNSLFIVLKKNTKRRPYLRSAYFGKEKIFFDYFWAHLASKNFTDRTRRMKFFPAAVDLIKNNRIKPSFIEVNNSSEVYYRFFGATKDHVLFCVQVKENKKTGQKFFMSCFPQN